MTTKFLWIRNWDRWQTYKKANPRWIKLYPCLLSDPDWVQLTEVQRAHLVGIWMLAADRSGAIPNDPEVIKKLCHFTILPDLKLFQALGFLKRSRHTRGRDRDRERDRVEAFNEIVIDGRARFRR